MITMSLAKEINNKLDQIIALKEELSLMQKEVPQDAVLTNKKTGDKMSVSDAVDIAQGVIEKVKGDLRTITNNGQNVRDIFTNVYYINDVMQDKEIVEKQLQEKLNKAKPNKLDSN